MPAPTKYTFTNIQQIKDHQFAGNHAFDAEAFAAIDRFVQDKNTSLADKAEALRQMLDRGMGEGRDDEIADDIFVQEYMDAMQ